MAGAANYYQVHEKDGCIFYVQVDHLSGEELGSAIDRLYAAGAHNVQVIPTITKKNRPAHIFLIDTLLNKKEAVEEAIPLELCVSGWHCMTTDHRFLSVDYQKESLMIREDGWEIPFDAEIKIAYAEEPIVRPEHRSSEKLRQVLEEKGIRKSLRACSQMILDAYQREKS